MTQTQRLTKPEWLPSEQLEPWLSLVALTTLLPAALDNQLAKDAGITHFEYMVMSMLAEAQERTLRMTEVAIRTNASLSRLSHVTRKMEEKGWIQRSACPDDARATNATLTRAGLAKWLESAPAHLNEVRHLVIEALTPLQLQQMQEINNALINRLDPEQRLQLRKPKGAKP